MAMPKPFLAAGRAFQETMHQDMPGDVRLSAIKAIRPAEPIHSVMAKETSWRARNPRSAARKQAQTIAASPGAVFGAPRLPPSPAPNPDGIVPVGFGSVVEAEAEKWEADPSVKAYNGPPVAAMPHPLFESIENAFKGESSAMGSFRRITNPWPNPEPPFRPRLGGRRVW